MHRSTLSLPLDVLRSFVAIAETGSMVAASQRVLLSQSALSLQIKRLEQLIARPLFQRANRRLTLTLTGEELVRYAREMLMLNDRALAALSGERRSFQARIGMIQDFADTILAEVLTRFSAAHPDAALYARIAGTRELQEMIAGDQLDVGVILVNPEDPRNEKTKSLRWFGFSGLSRREVLPVAIMEAPCYFRTAMLTALEAAGRRHLLVLESPSLSAVRATVAAGLGVTCRMGDFGGDVIPDCSVDLPALPQVGLAVLTRSSPSTELAHLASLLRSAIHT
jgi:DNA-binding transcriptional LysR family regulator